MKLLISILVMSWVLWENSPSGWFPFRGFETSDACEKAADFQNKRENAKSGSAIYWTCFSADFDPRLKGSSQ